MGEKGKSLRGEKEERVNIERERGGREKGRGGETRRERKGKWR